MAEKGLEKVIERNAFYWENAQRLKLAIILLFLLILGNLAFYSYFYNTEPPPEYFPTTSDGTPIRFMPLNLAYHPTEFVVSWAEATVLKIYSLDFVNYRQTLQEASDYFTLLGYLEFKQAYSASNNLLAVQQKKQVVSAQITGKTQVTSEGVLDKGIYAWNLNIPVTITYQNSANEVINQVGRILMQVQRGPLLVYPEGLAIAQLILQAQ